MTYLKNALALIAAVLIVGAYIYCAWLKEACDAFVNASTVREVTMAPLNDVKVRTANKVDITAKESKPNYSAMTVRELKKCCKGTGIKGWERLKKAELVAALSS